MDIQESTPVVAAQEVNQQVEGYLGSPEEIKIATFYGQQVNFWNTKNSDRDADANLVALKKYHNWRTANMGRGVSIVSVDTQNSCACCDGKEFVISVIIVKYRGIATYVTT